MNSFFSELFQNLGINRSRLEKIVTGIAVFLCVFTFRLTGFAQEGAAAQNQITAGKKFARLPMSFEANMGQTDSEVQFFARGYGYTLFLKPTEAVISLQNTPGKNEKKHHGRRDPAQQSRVNRSGFVLGMELIGAKDSTGAGVNQLPEQTSYFLGASSAQWRTNIASFSRVKFDEVYPGIDLVYYGNQQQLEYDFVVNPAASPDSIQLRFKGAEKIEINTAGDLVLSAGEKKVCWKKPVAFQDRDGVRKEITCDYTLKNKHEVGFLLAAYDSTLPLIIDPILLYSTYLGGNLLEAVESIAVDNSGNVYVTGETISANFPTVAGSYDVTKSSSNDVFVTKMNATGTARIFSTFVGGSGDDLGLGIALDSANNVYVTGSTESANFPMVNASDIGLSGASDAFVLKLNSTGTSLLYSTYFGGSVYERANAIAVDASGNAYIAGESDSEVSFPNKNQFQTGQNGNYLDAFVAKFNPSLSGASSWIYASALGNSPDERATGIALDSSGNAYLTGEIVTYEDPGINLDFPTVNPFQPSYGGGYSDVFVAKVGSAGNTLLFSTYLGGNEDEYGFGITVDGSANVYLTGQTSSTNFPILNAMQPVISGEGGFFTYDAFVTKLNSAGTSLLYSTFFGGELVERAFGIAVDANGYVYIAGQTSSENLPVTDGASQTNYGGGPNDAFVAKFNPAVSGSAALVFSSYFGGSGDEAAICIAVGTNQNFYIAGLTDSSTNFPITVGVVQPGYGAGDSDGFIAKFSSPSDLSLSQTVSPNPVTVGSNVTYTIKVNNNSLDTFSGVTMTNQLPSNIQYVSSATTRGSLTQANGLVTCNIGTLTNNTGATITIVGTTTNAGTVTNYATVRAIESEPNMSNNTAIAVSAVRGIADVTVTITNAPNPVPLGNNLTNTITVRNKGSWSATSVAMNYNFPAGTTYVSASTTRGTYSISSSGITYNPGTMTNGADAIITVILNVTGGTVLTNTATVTAFEIDPLPGNNSDTTTANVTGSTDLRITASGSPSLLFPGNALTYTLVVTNAGPSVAAGVIVSNTLPASSTYVSATSTAGTCTRSGQVVTCNIGTLNIANAVTITIVVTNSSAGVITNVGNAFLSGADINNANNSATVISTVSLPTLSISRSGTNVDLSWPSAATGFYLQTLPALGINNWVNVTNSPAVTNNQFLVRTPIRSGSWYFRLSSTIALPAPALLISRSGTNVDLSWPSSATGYTLQTLSTLGATNWSNVTNSPAVTNNQFLVRTPIQTGSRYFRLNKP
ncbi:MAG: SBBP repeat-containing protein [Verrucomicrobiota bacterium]